jgi:hypothetical protein
MGAELHIHLHEDVIDPPEEVLANFAFEPGQAIISASGSLVVVDLGEQDDTNDIQDWFLNRLDAVFSYYIVED